MVGVFYVHGFASGINYQKLDSLAKIINNDNVNVMGLQYDSDWSYDRIKDSLITQVNQYVNELTDIVFIGTSLGGLFARELANHYNERMIVINPVVDPFTQLKQFIGSNINFSTGKHFEFTHEILNSYKNYKLEQKALCVTYISDCDDVLIDNNQLVESQKQLFGKIIHTNTPHQINFDLLPNFKYEFDALLNTLAG